MGGFQDGSVTIHTWNDAVMQPACKVNHIAYFWRHNRKPWEIAEDDDYQMDNKIHSLFLEVLRLCLKLY